ncbi:hypothetical protein V2S66_32915 [Streptomyces sp. V4-01]|uniref:N-acetyltransferase domain-containing protein n=1 Tax=Actinacidiphila polyblastidii TaxID=3110430 RepID=A0ABU7PLQ3_9ACTN|nr:hypothetical protein [Streptomyces sp. V4-01]
MTETQVDGLLKATVFDPRSADHIAALTAMHQGYLLEELERTGHHAQGFPLAGWLRTVILGVDDDPIGFVAIDCGRRSVELIYVTPAHRSRGIATGVLSDLAATCPEPMQLKGPLSPGGQALAEKLGLSTAWSTPEQMEEAEAELAALEDAVGWHCPHRGKRRGDPRRPCRPCYRNLVTKTSARMIAGVAAMHCGDLTFGRTKTRPTIPNPQVSSSTTVDNREDHR